MNRWVLAWVAAPALTLTACTATSTHTPPASSASTSASASSASAPASSASAATATPRPLGRPNCDPPSPISRSGFPEVQGTSSRIQLWGLIMAAGPVNPVRVNEQVKIVWRITGVGDLHLWSVGPNGRTHPLQWGPDLHSGSDYQRPGQEWGAGYLFTQPGCWTLHAVRGTATANVWLKVAP